MVCEVCGTANAERLLYCQECGHKLHRAPSASSAGVTPATGGSESSNLESSHARSEATDATGGRSAEASEAAPVEGLCSTCSTQNPKGYRYCAVCGSPVPTGTSEPTATATSARPREPSIVPPLVTSSSPARSSRAPSSPAVPWVSASKTEQQPAVDAASSFSAAPPGLTPPQANDPTTCARCSGAIDAEARFCKHCGAVVERGAPPPAFHPNATLPDLLTGPEFRASFPPLDLEDSSRASAPVLALVPSTPPPGEEASPSMPPLRPSGIPLSGAQRSSVEPSQGPAAVGFASSAKSALAITAPGSPLGAERPRTDAARLVVVSEDGSDGAAYGFGVDGASVGRLEGEILLSQDPYVGPRHASFTLRAGRWFVRDLASLNGVYLRLRAPHRLEDRDLLLLGSQVVQFRLVNADELRATASLFQHGTQLFGSEFRSAGARLEQRLGTGATGDVHQVRGRCSVVGREQGELVFPDDGFMSRKHASITRVNDGSFYLEDLGSSNGTFVAIQGESPLESGDHLRIGQHLFRFEAHASPS